MNTTVDLTALSIEQLKALAYDRVRTIELARAELNILQEQITLREKNAEVRDESKPD